MEDFWSLALWALEIWLYLIVGLIMVPAMFGFSLGISETYMTILVKTLEVLLCSFCAPPPPPPHRGEMLQAQRVATSDMCILLCVLLHSGPR